MQQHVSTSTHHFMMYIPHDNKKQQ